MSEEEKQEIYTADYKDDIEELKEKIEMLEKELENAI